MTALKCMIVDDEPLAIDLVATFLTRMEINDITRCENGVDAFKKLQQEKFDLLLLDIDMPMLSGLDLLKTLPERPAVIITTAHRDYAVEGFELEVTDYLVKPFSFARFMQAVSRVYTPAPERPVPSAAPAFIYLKADRQLVRVAVNDIRYAESLRDYIRVNTAKGEYICHQSLTEFTAALPSNDFVRIHRSYTVALDKIETYRDHCVHMGSKIFPVSRENRPELLRRLGQ